MKLVAVLDAERPQVDEAPDAGRLHRRDHVARPVQVDREKLPPAVPVARDRHEVDHGVDAGERRRECRRAADVPGAQLDVRGEGRGEPPGDLLTGCRRSHERRDAVARPEQLRERGGFRRSPMRR